MNPSGLHQDLRHTFRYGRMVGTLLVLAALALYLLSGFYAVQADQRAILKRFGALVEDNIQPGIHYRLPWPFEITELVEATRIKTIRMHFGNGEAASGPYLITGDTNLVSADISVDYRIANAAAFRFHTTDPEALLKMELAAVAVKALASRTVDSVLTEGRQALQNRILVDLQAVMTRLDLGLHISSLRIDSIQPPRESGVALAFKDVASAREDKFKLIQEAEGERGHLLAQARSRANAQVQDSQAFASEVVAAARGESERFVSRLGQYRKAPELVTRRIYQESVGEIMGASRLVLIDPEAEN